VRGRGGADVTQYQRPILYPKQSDAFFTASRFGVCEATTKAGKTVGAMAWLLEQALIHGGPGRNYWWVAPQYEQAGIAFERYKRGLPASVVKRAVGTFPQRLTLANGASISFRSADKTDSLYGEDVHAAAVDEYTRAPAAVHAAMLSVTTATQGPIRYIGNVVGRGSWGYAIARAAEAGEPDWHYSKLSCVDAIAGLREIGQADAADRLELSVEQARATLQPDEFRMLYLAEAPEDDTNPIDMRKLDAAVVPASERPTKAYGLDLARIRDYTELVGLDDQCQWTTHWRHRGGEWATIVRMIRERVGTSVPVLCDSTGVGDAIVEDLSAAGVNVVGYKFTGPSRRALLSRLVTAINNGTVSVPAPVKPQLEALTATYTAAGVQYVVPEPMHDDGMMSLGLAIRCWDETVGVAAAPASVVHPSADRDVVTLKMTAPWELERRPARVVSVDEEIAALMRPDAGHAHSFGALGAGW
jgi:hypothetical protein